MAPHGFPERQHASSTGTPERGAGHSVAGRPDRVEASTALGALLVGRGLWVLGLRGLGRRGLGLRGLACGVLALTGCGPDAPPDLRPRVVATTAMIGDVVGVLAGDVLAVETLLGPGVDPHLYRPNRDDVAQLLGAALVVHNGLHLEGRMGETLAGLPDPSGARRVVAFAELLQGEGPELGLLGDPAANGALDPHAWMDPLRWGRAAERLAPELVALVPEPTRAAARDVVLDGNLPRFLESCERLVEFGDVCFATIPERSRVLVTAHDAFRYLGARFGLEVIGLQGISTESEAGVRRIEELVDLLVERKVPAVFVESSVPDRAVRSLVEGALAQGHAVAIGGELYSDAMGATGSREATYVGMLAHNITTITRGLGGRVPGGSFEIWRSVRQGRADVDAWDDLRPDAPRPQGGPVAGGTMRGEGDPRPELPRDEPQEAPR